MPTVPPVNPNAPQEPQRTEEVSGEHSKKFTAKPLQFLGMSFSAKEATQLWEAILQVVGREIDKDKAKSIKAIRSFNKENPDE